MELTKEEQKKLLNLARVTIEQYLKNGTVPSFKDCLHLNNKCGAFVTLHTKYGKLCGCIGHMESNEPLYKTISDMAIASATQDPRFNPLTINELNDIVIEISVLSPLQRIYNIDEIEMGKHGVLIKKGFRSGVFLPQVAVETGWSKQEFLNNLCCGKAGLPENAWQDEKTEMYIFTCDVFKEGE